MTKHGVVTLSESLHQELVSQGARVGVTIICPAFVPTQIAQSERYRPAEFAATTTDSAAVMSAQANLEKAVQAGRLTADDVAGAALKGVRDRALYVFPHAKIRHGIEERMSGIYAAFDSDRS